MRPLDGILGTHRLHRNLAGPPYRVVLGTNLPGDQWTAPINKDPTERPASLAI